MVHPLQEDNYANRRCLPKRIRVSLGTAIVLKLLDGKLDAEPSTAYLLTYKVGKCTANCGFCPQARSSKSSTELLSRVSWPAFASTKVLVALQSAVNQCKIRRICIQALNYPHVVAQVQALVKEIKRHSMISISVSCQPLNKEKITGLAASGVDRLGIALDAATEVLFDKVKGLGVGGTYRWENQFRLLNEATAVFGKGNVSTHIILGLGETEREATETIQKCVDEGILPALFAFTPVRGTALETNSPPSVQSYRRVQLARFIIVSGQARIEKMRFDSEGRIVDFGFDGQMLESVIENGLPFRTSGCPDCNRPFYNEKPSGPIYNYPNSPTKKEIEKIKQELGY
jgi:biotin synthase-related radical SAM superfamily protein